MLTVGVTRCQGPVLMNQSVFLIGFFGVATDRLREHVWRGETVSLKDIYTRPLFLRAIPNQPINNQNYFCSHYRLRINRAAHHLSTHLTYTVLANSSALKHTYGVDNFIGNDTLTTEEKRVRELSSYQVLPHEKDEELDSLVRLAARICDSPIGMINFIDDKSQWTKSSVGIEIFEVPRWGTFCNYTIQAERRMIVRDMLDDVRFKHSPFVVDEPNFRFYVGYNIKGTEGYNIGTLCIVDMKPKELTDHQLESLQIIAGEVEARLNLKKKNRELEETATFLRNSADLMFRINPDLFRIIDLNDEMEQLLGFGPGELNGKPLKTLGFGPDFFNELNEWSEQEASPGERFVHQVQVKCKDGSILWFEITISEKKGIWYATGRNIQETKEAEKALNETLKVLQTAQRIAGVAHWEWYPQEKRLNWSREMHNIFGTNYKTYKPPLPTDFMENIPEEDRHIVENAISTVMEGGTIAPFEHRCIVKGGEIIHVVVRLEVQRNEDGEVERFFGILQNITRQKETEKKIRESLREKEVMLAEIHHRVKNNLALISSIIQLEMSTITSDVELNKIQSILTRIESLALVHENLYQCDSLSRVPFGELLKDLVVIARTPGVPDVDPKIEIETESVDININQAIPFALAINQLIYSCIGKNRHPVKIDLSENDDTVELKIQKFGSPFSVFEGTEQFEKEDMSLQLFRSLLKQFGGEYKVEQGSEETVQLLTFSKNENKGSSDAQFI